MLTKTLGIRLIGLLVIGLAITLMPNLTAMSSGAQGRRPQQRVRRSQKPRIDYSQFSHVTHVTKKSLTCDSCHKFPTKNWNEVRKGDAAFEDVADFPEHSTCLNCHREQFFARQRPAPVICSNCHVKATPRDTTRFLFPSLGDVSGTGTKRREFISDFQVNFPHDKHADVFSFNAPIPKDTLRTRIVAIVWQDKKEPASDIASCPMCHQTYQPQGDSEEEYVTNPPKDIGDAFWLKKGTFKSIPKSHTTCFSCHNKELEIAPAPSDCNACHKLSQNQKPMADFDPKVATQMAIADETILRAWRRRTSSGTYRHEGGEHPNVSCLSCHTVATMNTLDPKTFKVPVKSCGGAEGCHTTATTDDGGILNYEIDQKKSNGTFECTKCHVRHGKQALPDSHVKAIPMAKPN